MTKIHGFSAKLVQELVDTHDKRLVLKFVDKENQPHNLFISKDDAGALFVLLHSFFSGTNRVIDPKNIDTYGELIQ